jgi:two-component system, LytTR family, response regulator
LRCSIRQGRKRTGWNRRTPQETSELLLIKSRGRLLFLKMSELKWVEAERDYIRLHLEKESHFVRDTMNNFQKRLSKDEFIRIHRSTNVNKISEILPLLGATTPWS